MLRSPAVASLIALMFFSGCQHYCVDETVRHVAAYNALTEPERTPFPGEKHSKLLADPSADEADAWSLLLGGRYENDSYSGIAGSAGGDRFDAGRLSAGYTGTGGDWRWGCGLYRPGGFNYSLGGDSTPNLEVDGDLWAAAASLGWGGDLRFGLTVEGLYGYLNYRNAADIGESAVIREETLIGWRSHLGLRLLDGDWRLGFTTHTSVDLGYGAGLPWELELWSTIPLTGYRDERYNLELAVGGRLYPETAELRGEDGQDLEGLLADELYGSLALAWTTAGNLGVRVGARLGGYPLRDEDAERMLTQDYGLQLSFGSEPRWTVSGIYGLIGGLADDAYSSSRLDLTVEAAWE